MTEEGAQHRAIGCFSMKYHFPVLKYCRKNLVIDNESQHSAVEKKREKEEEEKEQDENSKEEEEEQQLTIQKQEERERKKENERRNINAIIPFFFHCSKL